MPCQSCVIGVQSAPICARSMYWSYMRAVLALAGLAWPRRACLHAVHMPQRSSATPDNSALRSFASLFLHQRHCNYMGNDMAWISGQMLNHLLLIIIIAHLHACTYTHVAWAACCQPAVQKVPSVSCRLLCDDGLAWCCSSW